MEKQQGILKNYIASLTDINYDHNPLSLECIFIVNEAVYDQYQDMTRVERDRVKKRCIVKKNPEMYYVQEFGEDLLEDTDEIPWIVSITSTNLKEKPKAFDQILIQGVKYTISKVKPINRNVEAVFNCVVYPERSEDDFLQVYKVLYSEGVLSIVWGGDPKEMSFDGETWIPFKSFFSLQEKPSKLYLKDNETIVEYDI